MEKLGMVLKGFRAAGARRVALIAGAAVLAIPADAFGCWNEFVQENGCYRQMYGAYWELDHCVQSWPDGSREVQTVCYYKRVSMY